MLECVDLDVRFGSIPALSGASLTVSPGSVAAVIGPSGCGKSTLLRVIAGLETPSAGTVRWQGEDLASVPAHRRGFGLMFQDYALFPHLDVAENVSFSLDVAGSPAVDTAARVAELLELVGLGHFADRSVERLSGGEQQRVALARTLAPSPGLLMLDEPLGALDRSLRDELLPEMRRIFAQLGTTVLYVTHDHDEAFAVADEVFVMRAGTIVGSGPPEGLWRHPPDLETARFFGFEPILLTQVDGGVADLGIGTIAVDAPPGAYVAALSPFAASVDAGGSVRGRVVDSSYTTAGHQLTVEVGAHALTVRSPVRVRPGNSITLRIDPERTVLYPTSASPSSSSV
jgi:ABC-type Fe3+/spermidine/putrescine transport system ATPase subunit